MNEQDMALMVAGPALLTFIVGYTIGFVRGSSAAAKAASSVFKAMLDAAISGETKKGESDEDER